MPDVVTICGVDRASGGNKTIEIQVDKITGAVLLQPGPPAAATAVGAKTFAVTTSEAALTGSSPSGFTFLNVSTGGQTICLGDAGVVTTANTPRMVLAPGAALDRASWQDLSIVHAVATASGAELLAVPL